jgi:hypothetical protein
VREVAEAFGVSRNTRCNDELCIRALACQRPASSPPVKVEPSKSRRWRGLSRAHWAQRPGAGLLAEAQPVITPRRGCRWPGALIILPTLAVMDLMEVAETVYTRSERRLWTAGCC